MLTLDLSHIRRNILILILVAMGAGLAAFFLIAPIVIRFSPEAIQETFVNYLVFFLPLTFVLLAWAYRYLQPIVHLSNHLRAGQTPPADLAQSARTVAFNTPFSIFVMPLICMSAATVLSDLAGVIFNPNYALVTHISESLIVLVLTNALTLITSIISRHFVRPVLVATADLATELGHRYEIRLRLTIMALSLGIMIYLFLGILTLNLVHQQATSSIADRWEQWAQDVALIAPRLDRESLMSLIQGSEMTRQHDVFVVDQELNQLIFSPRSQGGKQIALRALTDQVEGFEEENERYTLLKRLERPDGDWWLGVTDVLSPLDIPAFRRAVLILIGFGLVMGSSTVAFTLYLTRDITRDLKYVTSRLFDIARHGQVGEKVQTLSLDEVGDLVAAFNEVQSTVATQQEKLARHQQRLLALRDISQQTSSIMEPEQLWNTVFREVERQLGYQRMSVFLLDETAQELYLAATTNPSQVQTDLRIDLRDPALSQPPGSEQDLSGAGAKIPLAGYVATTRQPSLVPDASQSPLRMCDDARSGLGVPMTVGDRLIGSFCVRDERTNAFDAEDVQVLIALAKQLATVLENNQLFRRLKRQAEEMQHLYEASLALSSLTDFTQVVDHICQIAHDVTKSDSVSLFLYEPLDNTFVLVGQVDQQPSATTRAYEQKDDLSRTVLQTRQPILIFDALEDSSVPQQVIDAGIRSLIAAPVISRTLAIGVLYVSSCRANTYTQDDVRLTLALASQAAIAIENARLLEEANTNAKTMARRARNLLMINRISTSLASSLNATEIFGAATRHLVELMDEVHHSSVLIFEPNAEYGQIVAEYPDLGATSVRLPLKNNPTVEQVIATRQPLVVSDVVNDPVVAVVRGELLALDIRALLVVPLIGRGQVIGSIGLDVIGRTHTFTEEEIDLCETVAAQAAIAASNARLLYDLRQQSRALTRKSLELADESSKLDAVLRNIADGLVVIDLGDRIMLSNPAFKRLVGVPPHQLLQGLLLTEVFSMADLQAVIDEARAHPDAAAVADLTLPDRRVIKATATTLRLGQVPEIGGESQAAGIITVLRDITHEVEVDRMKTDFVSAVSHELRTPLTSILGFANLIRREFRRRIAPYVAGDAQARRSAGRILENLAIIETESQRLTRLINDVLDIAKMEAGRIEWYMTEVDLREVAEESINASEVVAEEEALSVIVQLAPDLPRVWGDRDRLIQVTTNLLSNAIKFTEEGQVLISGFYVSGSGDIGSSPAWEQPPAGLRERIDQLIQRDKGKHPQGWVVVEVADTGIGIAAQDLPLVFERFGQVGDTLTGKPKGTGLGLSICKEIIEHHDGQIWVESELGRGSTFYFAVPVVGADRAKSQTGDSARVPRQPAALLQTDPAPPDTRPAAGRDDQPPLILIVDDEPNICHLLQQELTEEGYRVAQACSGTQGLAQARQLGPDLIILDILMPDISGYDIIQTLRSEPETTHTPIVVVSITEAAERARELGAQACLGKPVNVPHLLEAVERLLPTFKPSRQTGEEKV